MQTSINDLVVILSKEQAKKLQNELRVLMMKDSKPTGRCVEADITNQHEASFPTLIELYRVLARKME